MREGKVLDIDQQAFPDPLINYNIGALSQIPTEYKITARDLSRFWVTMWEQYGLTEMDDVWLSINGIKYLMDLRPGDVIYKVVPEDLDGFMVNRQIGHYEDS